MAQHQPVAERTYPIGAPSLDSETTGTALRDQGEADVLAADTAAHRMYAAHVEAAIDHLINQGRPFTAEDAHDLIERDHPGAQAHHPNVLGAVFSKLRHREDVRHLGYRRATRAPRRSGTLAIWEGVRR